MARLYGMGSLWLRKSKRHPRGEYWLRFYVQSKQRTENAHVCECHHARAKAKAEKLLAKRIGQGEAGNLASTRAGRTLVEDLADLLFKTHRTEMIRKIPEDLPEPTKLWREQRVDDVVEIMKARWKKHLAGVFGHRKAALVRQSDLSDYINARHKAKARNGTINRELALLRRMFTLGFKSTPRLVPDVPTFPARLPEHAREGFIEDADFEKLLKAIEEKGLRTLVMCAYRLGFRKAELQNLLVVQVNDGRVSLFKGATKNGKARIVKMPQDVRKAVEECAAGKQPDDYVFCWKDGSPIRDFRASWKKATTKIKRPELLFHDLRRSTVRRMRKLGVPTAVGMKITGHLTRKVFDDYDAANDLDVADAAEII
jgi:hypothetical protein